VTVTIELFYSPMCLYCPEAKKILMEIAEELDEKIRVKEINVLSSAGMEKAEKYGVKGVPTIIVSGRVKVEGVPARERLRKIIQQELKNFRAT